MSCPTCTSNDPRLHPVTEDGGVALCSDEFHDRAETVTPAYRAAVLKTLMDRVGEAYKVARAEADDVLRELYREHGSTNIAVAVDGVKVAKLSVRVNDAEVVVDDAALLKWAERDYAHNILEEHTTVRYLTPAFREILVKRLEVDPERLDVFDGETGEVITWARYVKPGPGQTTMTFEKNGRSDVAAAWRAGVISVPDLLELEA